MTQIVSKAVGIDLGTTNSAVAVMDPSDREVLIHRDQSKSQTTPSCVWCDPRTGELVVGRKAFIRKGAVPEPVSSVKRLMGSRTELDLSGRTMTPPQISAAILGEMKQQIEADVAGFDGPTARWIVDRAIVTVPAYFDQPQIDATREAAELAGFEVLGLLHEPTAAASHYCWRTSTQDGTFLVYDLGGGTFDVSVVRCTAGAFEVLGVSGNNRLGGDDIDTALARHLQALLQEDGWALDLDPANDPEDALRFNQLKMLAEGAKKALADRDEYVLRDNGQLRDKEGNPVVIETVLERPDLEEVARPLIERTFSYCDEAVSRAEAGAGISLADVDQIILAGGSTHLPLVRELVTRELCASDNPGSARPVRAACGEPVYKQVDTVVALGAAVRAAAVGGLAVYNPERTVRLSFRGTASTSTSRTRVGGTVEALDAGIDLTGGRIRLSSGEYEDEAELGEGGSFAFGRIPVQPDAESLLNFEVFDADGELCATAGRPVAHSSEGGRIAADTTNLAITAKALLLDVERAGRQERMEVISAMQRLPFEANLDLSHPGTSSVQFQLYQQSRPVQNIHVDVPSSTPKGTAIRLNLRMDEFSLITVRGSIGDTAFEASVELPPEREMPGEEEVDELKRRFQEEVQFLPAGPQNTARTKWAVAYEAFLQARKDGDAAQAVHEFEQLEDVVASVGTRDDGLQPPKADFDQLVQNCQEAHGYLAANGVAQGTTFDSPQVARAIEEQRLRGEKAWAAGDQRAYSEVIQQLDGHLRYMVGLTVEQHETPRSLAEQADELIRNVEKSANDLSRLRRAEGDATRQREAEAIAREAQALRKIVDSDPQRARQEAGKLYVRLKQMAPGQVGQEGDKGRERNVPQVP